eukprot:2908365-Prymnesium_polylepis.1
MLPPGVAETTGGGGEQRYEAWGGAADERTTDDSGCRHYEPWMTGAEQLSCVFRCGDFCCGAACVFSPGVEKTTGGAGGQRHAAREGANGTRT